ncbi:hypothetical protein B0H21DRAFT_755354 [Amylocystis lapponica]|nr:hypothetical protein B0H21DRAFT_755354 [Amylocystis lapponica]
MWPLLFSFTTLTHSFALYIMPSLQSLRDQLVAVAATMASIQEQYVQVVQQTQEHTQQLQTRVDELESERLVTTSRIQSLQTENAELERLIEIRQPEAWRAISARNAALRKLKHTRRILRDLLDERRVGPNVSCVGAQPGVASVSKTSSEHSWDVDEMDGSSSSSNDSDDETTVRPHARTDTATTSDTSSPPVTIVEGGEPEMDIRAAQIAQALDDTDTDTDEPPPGSYHVQELASTVEENEWWIEYTKAPATSDDPIGAFSYDELEEALELDEETTVCIGSLEWTQEPCLRLHIHQDMVFLVDPIVLEEHSATYLISWGTAQVNNNIRRYITEGKPTNPSLHMLVSPAGKDNWWYLGLQTWNPATVEPIWPRVSSKKQKELAIELQRRWNNALSSQEIAERIAEGELTQFCVQLSGGGRLAERSAFARNRLKLEEMEDDDSD